MVQGIAPRSLHMQTLYHKVIPLGYMSFLGFFDDGGAFN
jgi:hypothetical protein